MKESNNIQLIEIDIKLIDDIIKIINEESKRKFQTGYLKYRIERLILNYLKNNRKLYDTKYFLLFDNKLIGKFYTSKALIQYAKDNSILYYHVIEGKYTERLI